MRGAILVISGPSGAGKSTLIREVVKDIGPFYFSISTTTRTPREGEVEGTDYFFTTKEAFEKEIQEGHFLEWAQVHENYYGTSLKPVLEALKANKLVIFDIDVQGHESVQKRLGDITTSVFVTTPDFDTLKSRLTSRKTDSQEVIQKRLTIAQKEIAQIDDFDFLIINDALDEAIVKLKSVANAARLKHTKDELKQFKSQWLA